MTYEDERLGIVIQYPSNWERIVHLDGFITLIAPRESNFATYPADLDFGYKSYPQKDLSLEEVTRVQLKNLTQNY